MVSAFLSYSIEDKHFVRGLAAALERDVEIKVSLDEGEIVPAATSSTKSPPASNPIFVLVIMSPDAVGPKWVKEEWTDAYWEQTNKGRVQFVGVLYKDCAIPRLIPNKKYFDLHLNPPEGFGEIRTWLLTECAVTPTSREESFACLTRWTTYPIGAAGKLRCKEIANLVVPPRETFDTSCRGSRLTACLKSLTPTRQRDLGRMSERGRV
jgi:hypothetical protein